MRIVSSTLIAALLTAAIATPTFAADAEPVRLDVGLAEGTDPAILLAPLGAGIKFQQVEGLNAIAVDVPADRAAAALVTLGGAAGVRYVQRGAIVQANSVQSNIGFAASEIPEAWTWTTGSADVTVAVVDTGVTPTVDLGTDRLAAGYDFVDGDADASDGSGHGTLVAGVVAGDIDNNAGTSGVCDKCQVLPVRVLSDRGTLPAEGTSADVAAGIVWAADHGAQIINLSASTTTGSRLLWEAVQYADRKGSLVVASAGNAASTAHRFPAAYEPALAVHRPGSPGNTPLDRWVDVSANNGMLAVGKDGVKQELRGASGATALVSGVAALALAMKPSLTAGDLRTRIQRDAEMLSGYPSYAAPLVNAARLVHGLGGTDTVKPVVRSTGLTANEWVNAKGKFLEPVAEDDHGIDRVEILVGDKVVATVPRKGPGWWVTLRPPAGFNGPMPVTLRAHDYAGNVGEATTVVQADTKAPSGTFVAPSPMKVIHYSAGVAVSSPDTDLARVSSAVNGTVLTWDAKAKLWRGNAWIDHDDHISVNLEDRAGNLRRISVQVRNDTEPPTGGTVGPASGAKVRGTFTSTLTGVTDLGEVATAELWANGRYVGADKAFPYALAVRTGTYSGSVKLTWKVTDQFGQDRTLPVRTVVADNRAPAVSITKAPKHKAKVKGTVKVSVKAADTSGIARVELIVNGKVVARDLKAAYVLSVNSKKQKKTMRVQVRAYDKLGNVRYTSVRTWYRK